MGGGGCGGDTSSSARGCVAMTGVTWNGGHVQLWRDGVVRVCLIQTRAFQRRLGGSAGGSDRRWDRRSRVGSLCVVVCACIHGYSCIVSLTLPGCWECGVKCVLRRRQLQLRVLASGHRTTDGAPTHHAEADGSGRGVRVPESSSFVCVRHPPVGRWATDSKKNPSGHSTRLDSAHRWTLLDPRDNHHTELTPCVRR